MGITRGTIKLIAMTVGKAQAKRNVITFGVQGVQSSYAEAKESILESGLDGVELLGSEVVYDDVTQFGKTIHQTTLFRLLDFEVTESLDYFQDENPTHVVDLNMPLQESLHGQYSLVYDGGTMEHCFNPPQVMMNAMALAKPGGRVIHHVPMNNWVDHGFYQFSPTLFFDFYSVNGFTELEMKIHLMGKKRESFIRYNPRTDEPLPYSLGSKTRAMIFFSATKPAATGEIKFPIQGRYRELFGKEVLGSSKPRKGLIARMRRSWNKRSLKWTATSL